MKQIFKEMLQLFEQGQSFVQATILSQSGSAPRTAGAKMIILADGTISGTIGGGLVEASVQQLAAAVYESKKSIIQVYHLTGVEAGQMDMICGGRLEVLVQYMDASNRDFIKIYRELMAAVEKRKKVVLVTPLPDGEENDVLPSFLIEEGGSVIGNIGSSLEQLEEIASSAKGRVPHVFNLGEKRFLVEPVCPRGTVYIFGAGHVSQKLAQLTTMVDFRTIILDDRSEFANRERFAAADEIFLLESFELAFKNLNIDTDSYIVIVTRGHAHDKTVLAQALRTKARYIGMIGSLRKRDTIYRALLADGFLETDLKRVFSPIGLAIQAETPEEIAVSITAELIRIRVE